MQKDTSRKLRVSYGKLLEGKVRIATLVGAFEAYLGSYQNVFSLYITFKKALH